MDSNEAVKPDTTLRVVIFSVGEDGEHVHQTIEWAAGTDLSITLGAGKSIRIEDPTDGDTKSGSGTWKQT
ncbi:MAG: hypothetical protein K8J09_11045 [Planctomycetes bacterium]|nr:hypothetical protein [Planctomycetota bacterium]MCC7397764.1 hypothetical protein [Planctomycetota bacterium]